jgi:hypothetical protein
LKEKELNAFVFNDTLKERYVTGAPVRQPTAREASVGWKESKGRVPPWNRGR